MLEKVLFAHRPSREIVEDGDDRYVGMSQLQLLWDIPNRLLGSKASALFIRLRRKFKGYEPRKMPDYSFREIKSPVPTAVAASMSLTTWLSKMRRFNDDTGWDRKGPPFKSGGIVEVSRQFEEEVSKNPKKFIPIARMFDERVSSVYWAGLLNGITATDMAADEVFALAMALASRRPNDPEIQRAINSLVEKRESDHISDQMLTLLRTAALTSPDPSPDRPKRKKSGDARLDDPFQSGFNSVRGRTIRTYVRRALNAGPKEARHMVDAVEKCAHDPSSAVRACLIDVLPLLLRDHSDVAKESFHIAIDGRPELLDSQPVHEFIYWSLRRDLPRLVPLMRRMMKSEIDETRVAAGRLITLASFDTPSMKSLFDRCISGDEHLRKGVASVLARNVDDLKIRSRCFAGLKRLFKDKDSGVGHTVAHAFDHLPAPDVEIARFTRAYIESDVVAVAPDSVARYATRVQLSDSEFALDVGEQLVKRFGLAVTDYAQSTGMLDDDLVNISMAVYSSASEMPLRRRAMDLFEDALRMGSRFAKEALERADR